MDRTRQPLALSPERGPRILCCLGLWLLGSARPVLAQCIMCRESLKSGGSDDLILGFMFSTVLLTSVPLLIISGFAFAFYRAAQQRARQATSSIPESGADDEAIP